ncbi:hypothetical protein ACR9E3_10095 [Actinomycetospora sp. C-140]
MSVQPDRVVATNYMLVFNPPAGWLLAGYRHGRRCWVMNLAAHGASPDAATRIAQAVAVRVLDDRGITTRGWLAVDATDEHGPYRAAL